MGQRLSQIDIPSRFADAAPAWVIQALVGMVITILASALRAALEELVQGVVPFALLFPALLIATLLAGWQAGLWTTILGALTAWYFLLDPRGAFFPLLPEDGVSLSLFVLAAAIIVAVAEAYRRSARALELERAQQTLLINELNHRVKNTLATVQSVAAMTLGETPGPGARAALEGRIFALARAHDILTRNAWERADLAEVVAQALSPFSQPGRIEIDGPLVQLDARQVLGLSMALHELATNAAKYGALSTPAGRVRIGWRLDGHTLDFTWTEQSGPQVSPPSRRGFGSRLLEKGLARELDGQVTLAFEPSGVVCAIRTRL